jgi:hypothetical protein
MRAESLLLKSYPAFVKNSIEILWSSLQTFSDFFRLTCLLKSSKLNSGLSQENNQK